ncbi:MAG: invasion protein CiaB, partial [Campylobacterales bacterium]
PQDEAKQKTARAAAREASRALHESRQQTLIAHIESEALLTPFYRAVLSGMHETGLAFNRWHPVWLETIGESHRLIEQAAGGAQHAAAWLEANRLHDPDETGAAADRSYSVLTQGGKILTYAQAFAQAVGEVTSALGRMRQRLEGLEDDRFNEKTPWLNWIGALIAALGEESRSRTLIAWRAVDEAWMAIGGPIQPGHPLEYYEDAYRRAVAPEWDVRLSLPGRADASQKAAVAQMARGVYHALGMPEGEKAVLHAENSLEKTRLFMGRPLLFYGALLDGLFSAQVVPNDEQVSRSYGKKIFAFADSVLQTARMRPFMALEEEIFEPEFLERYRTLLHRKSTQWMEIYRIETVGHELGHVLWMDDATETAMNKNGLFKLIEEFKATAGGLMTYFESKGDKPLLAELMVCHIKRSVELIGWRESPEVSAYYHEALIHLSGLFESGAARFEEGRLGIDLSPGALEAVQAWYRRVYADLARHYLLKQEAGLFLARFVQGGLPVNPAVAKLVTHYWQRWQAIGRDVSKGTARV